MKKYLISAVLSTQLLFSSGIPTVDVLAISSKLRAKHQRDSRMG